MALTPTDTGARVRALTAQVVFAVVYERKRLDRALAAVFSQNTLAPGRDAALVQEMAYGSLRFGPQLEAIAARLLGTPLRARDHDIAALLHVGLYQLMYMRVPPHAAVAETVEAAEQLRKPWAKGLLNACLRRFLREADALQAEVRKQPSAATNHPAWLLTQIERAWPQRSRAIIAASNQHPPMTLRVNLRRTTRAAYLAQLQDADMRAAPVDTTDCGLTLERPVAVSALPGFAEGLVSVQDAAAQLATILLDAAPGQRVLDACAAPGGKLCHMLERYPELGRVVALERDAARLATIKDNLARLQLDANLVHGDATQPPAWWDRQPFDRIVLDAPCSATGVIRRHPDVKFRRRPQDLRKLLSLQENILTGLWPLLVRGGKLLYVTCSILPAENDEQMRAFLARRDDACELPLSIPFALARRPGAQILPGDGDMDGFYYACLQKI